MPTPTSDRVGEVEPGPPAGLPDAATLARWANEFFTAAPLQAAGHMPRTATSAAPITPVAVGGPTLGGPTTGVPTVPGPINIASFEHVAAPISAAHAGTSFLTRLSAADLTHPVLPFVPAPIEATRASVPLPAPLASAAPSFYFLDMSRVADHTRAPVGHPAFDVETIRRDFPILQERVHGRPLIWFDNAATTQKPSVVIERLNQFYRHENSNIHRAAHELAARATDAYEGARRQVQKFLGAASPGEIVFVRGATEAINLVAQSWGRKNIGAGDEILISHLEHHANIVPWQMLAAERGAALKVVPVDQSGQLRMDELQRLINTRTKLLSITHVSNALGTVTPVRDIIEMGHRAGVRVLIDGAQSVSHMPIDVQAMDADFFVLSGHKIFAPTGIGVLYGKAKVLDAMPPWQGGGNMIDNVTFEGTTYQPPPGRFEAGTGNIADAAGLGAALEYLTTIGMPNIEHYEAELLAYATHQLASVPGLSIIGTAPQKASVLSFVIDGIEPTAIGSALNQEGIAVRAGHHCAQPILRRFGYEATVRASLAFYNTSGEIDVMVAALRKLAASGAKRRG